MPLFVEASVELSLQINYYTLITFEYCGKIVPVNQNLYIL